MTPSVAVVGGGIGGTSAALALAHRGIDVVLLDRGHRIGGRMASRTLRDTGLPYDGRVVDVGAAYLTVDDPEFQAVVDIWVRERLARPWTDTFATATPSGLGGTTTGPTRYATPGGLRSLVEDLAADLRSVIHPREVATVARADASVLVDGEPFDAVVLAMPDAQARDVLALDDPLREATSWVSWAPVLCLTAAYADRSWPELDGAFVNDSETLTFLVDDGRRRGDGAPVLVAHSHPALAAQHLDDPAGAAPEMLAALAAVLGTPPPVWHEVRRWSLARPEAHRAAPFALVDGIGVCGDAWGARPRIQTAWLSGRRLGEAVAESLGR